MPFVLGRVREWPGDVHYTCGYEPLPVDESGEAKGQGQPNRRTRILEKRMQKLAGFGMYDKVNSTLLATLTNE